MPLILGGKSCLPCPWQGLQGSTHGSWLPASTSPGAVLLTGTTKSSGTCVPWRWQRSGIPSRPCRQLALRQSCEPWPGPRLAPLRPPGTTSVRGNESRAALGWLLLPRVEARPCGRPYFLKLLHMYREGRENFSVLSPLHLHPQTCVLPSRERGVTFGAGRRLLPFKSKEPPVSLKPSQLLRLRGEEAESSVCS